MATRDDKREIMTEQTKSNKKIEKCMNLLLFTKKNLDTLLITIQTKSIT